RPLQSQSAGDAGTLVCRNRRVAGDAGHAVAGNRKIPARKLNRPLSDANFQRKLARKQFIHLELALGYALLVAIDQKRLERRPVGLKAVWPRFTPANSCWCTLAISSGPQAVGRYDVWMLESRARLARFDCSKASNKLRAIQGLAS